MFTCFYNLPFPAWLLNSLVPSAKEMLVRKGTNGETWVQHVLDGLVSNSAASCHAHSVAKPSVETCGNAETLGGVMIKTKACCQRTSWKIWLICFCSMLPMECYSFIPHGHTGVGRRCLLPQDNFVVIEVDEALCTVPPFAICFYGFTASINLPRVFVVPWIPWQLLLQEVLITSYNRCCWLLHVFFCVCLVLLRLQLPKASKAMFRMLGVARSLWIIQITDTEPSIHVEARWHENSYQLRVA